MTLPKSSNFPKELDNDNNLFLVHDSLRVRLLEDYNPGDTSIYIEGDYETIIKFPPTGIITLTEQCSEIEKRALSFYYSTPPSEEPYSFQNIEILPEFSSLDSVKIRKYTNVTMNVMNVHHNHLKDALIKIQEFLGTKYSPASGTITERINSLKRIALAPRVWFSINSSYGLAPMKILLKNESIRIGKEYLKQTWSFKEVNSSNEEETIIIETNNEEEYKANSTVEKVLVSPGIYTIGLSVETEYGSDYLEFKESVSVRTECPEEAVIQINHRASQNIYLNGDKPKVRSLTNTFIDIEVPEGLNPNNPEYFFSGEYVGSTSTNAVDPIIEYTWILADNLPHPNMRTARASYDIGGYYDITLRVDTSFGSYRITSYDDSIDIIESSNLWMFNYKLDSENPNSSGDVSAFEFGLKSETFKTLGNSSLYIDRNNSFLGESPLNYDNTQIYNESTFERSKKEFEKNIEFVSSGTATSGERGTSIIFWAKGGSNVDSKEIMIKKYNGFDDVYENLSPITNRPWNWTAFSSQEKTYFLFGQYSPIISGQNPVNPEKIDYDLSTQSATTPVTFSVSDFENGADELLYNPSYFDEEGRATNGYFATYKSAWKGQTGYLIRNSSVNEFFRLGDFYKTSGTLVSPFGLLTKLTDMPGSVKTEGELVSLFNGVFFFNNSGEIAAWNDTSLSWEIGRASSTSLSFRSVQDTSSENFDDKSNTLKATSDKDRIAYLSYDYSTRAFVKFNGTDLTFTILKQRPEGKQFTIGVY